METKDRLLEPGAAKDSPAHHASLVPPPSSGRYWAMVKAIINMVLNAHINHKAYQGWGEVWRGYGGGGRGRL